jgi:hypothetical protein
MNRENEWKQNDSGLYVPASDTSVAVSKAELEEFAKKHRLIPALGHILKGKFVLKIMLPKKMRKRGKKRHRKG